MRIIGLKIFLMDKSIQKVLEPGWYPFGDYSEPDEDGFLKVEKRSSLEKSVYRLRKRQPEVSVSCIVGMNGAGKSTVIDIIYRIINNLAVTINKAMRVPLETEMEYAYGVNADLYCECDDYINLIRCRGDELKYYRYKYNSRHFPLLDEKIGGSYANKVLSQLFYTIGINYSLYAFNEEDYVSDMDENINGNWLRGVFHKNDGYLAPLTLVPFRERGDISVKKENDLAQQRITALAILSRAKKRQFPEGYYPRMLHCKLNEKYKDEKMSRFKINYQPVCLGIDLDKLVDMFEEAWKGLLPEVEREIDWKSWKDSKEFELALFYIAYKSVKICLTYNDYYQALNIEDQNEVCSKKAKVSLDNNKKRTLLPDIRALVHALWQNNDHITLKIHQCLAYLKTGRWRNVESMAVDDLIKEGSPQDYDDVIKLLPPPFYALDVTFIKKSRVRKEWVDHWDDNKGWNNDKPWGGMGSMEEVSAWSDDKGTTFKLSSMSSGEKQVLVALSYVLYHIKNIQSVDEANYRVPYHHINIIFDEVELYFHPDYQRRFLAMLIESLSWTNIDRRKIRSVHILMATHSPFVLTDVLTERTLYLREGKREEVTAQTFGANYYDLLDNSFFFEKSAIGEISSKATRRWIKNTEHNGELPSEEAMDMIGDPFVKRYLQVKHTKKDGKDVQTEETDE